MGHITLTTPIWGNLSFTVWHTAMINLYTKSEV